MCANGNALLWRLRPVGRANTQLLNNTCFTVSKRRIQIGRNVLEPSLRYALSDETRESNFFSAPRFGIRMKIEELLREAGAGPKHLTPLPNYFRSKQPVVFVQPIIVQAQTLDAEFCLRYGFTESSVSAFRGRQSHSASKPERAIEAISNMRY